MANRPFIVVSGMPASGKTTLAIKLAEALALPLLDKDHILEALFAGEGVITPRMRQRLSRASDDVLAAVAAASQGAVIVSFWRHPAMDGQSGTPTDWLSGLSDAVVEVHCTCSPDLAARRFLGRERHPGHNDASRRDGLRSQFESYSSLGPLGVGPLIEVRTDRDYDLDVLCGVIGAQFHERSGD